MIGGIPLGLKSSQKRERQNEKHRLRNRTYKSKARTMIRKAFLAMEEGNLDTAKVATAEAIQSLDKAAAKGVIHKNNASRRKSRLMARLSVMEKAA
jgi:small subunit ribosomal protein S20